MLYLNLKKRIIVFLALFLIMNFSLNLSFSDDSIKEPYIIIFNDTPLVSYYLKSMHLENASFNSSTLNLINSHFRLKASSFENSKTPYEIYLNDIKKHLTTLDNNKQRLYDYLKKIRTRKRYSLLSKERETKPLHEFSKLVSGVVINLTPREAEEIKKLPFVKSVEEDKRFKLFVSNFTPSFFKETIYNLYDFSSQYTGKGVKVAVIDSGIDYSHPDLGNCTFSQFINNSCPKFLGGYDFGDNDNNPMDEYGHGTAVAGIIAANGTFKGVAPDAKLYAYKVSYFDDDGDLSIPLSAIIAALERSVDPNNDYDFSDHVDIVSMSLGASFGLADDILSQVVDETTKLGVLVVAAAGNDGDISYIISSPSTARTAISVAAYNSSNGKIATFSSRGPALIWQYGSSIQPVGSFIFKPEVSAPGVDIVSTAPSGSCSLCSPTGYITASGTSFSTPYVSGLASLLVEKFMENNITISPSELKSLIVDYANDLDEPLTRQGAGLYDPNKSLNANLSFDPSVVNFEDIRLTAYTRRKITVRNFDNITHIIYFNLSSLGSYASRFIISNHTLEIPPHSTRSVYLSINQTNITTSFSFLGLMQIRDITSSSNMILPVSLYSFGYSDTTNTLGVKIISNLSCDTIRKNSSFSLAIFPKQQTYITSYQMINISSEDLNDDCFLNISFRYPSKLNYTLVLVGYTYQNSSLDYYLVSEDLNYPSDSSYEQIVFNLSNLSRFEIPCDFDNVSVILRRVLLNLVSKNSTKPYDIDDFHRDKNYEAQYIYSYPIPMNNEKVFFNQNLYSIGEHNYNLSFEIWFEWIKPHNLTIYQNKNISEILYTSKKNVNYDIYIYKREFVNDVNDFIFPINESDREVYYINQNLPYDLTKDYSAYRYVYYINDFGIKRLPLEPDYLTLSRYKVIEFSPRKKSSFAIVNEYYYNNRPFFKEIYSKDFSFYYKGFSDYSIFNNDQNFTFSNNVTMGSIRFDITPLNRFMSDTKTSASFLKSGNLLLIYDFSWFYDNSTVSKEETKFASSETLYSKAYPFYPEYYFIIPLNFKSNNSRNTVVLNYNLYRFLAYKNVTAMISFDPSICPNLPTPYNLSFNIINSSYINITFNYYNPDTTIINLTLTFNDNTTTNPQIDCHLIDENLYKCSSLQNISNVSYFDLSLFLKDNVCYNYEEVNISPFFLHPKDLEVNLSQYYFRSGENNITVNITLDNDLVKNIPLDIYMSNQLIERVLLDGSPIILHINVTTLSPVLNLTFYSPLYYPYNTLNKSFLLYRNENTTIIYPNTPFVNTSNFSIKVRSIADFCNFTIYYLRNNTLVVSDNLTSINETLFSKNISLNEEGLYQLNISCYIVNQTSNTTNVSNETNRTLLSFISKTFTLDICPPTLNISLWSNLTLGNSTFGSLIVHDVSPITIFIIRVKDPFNNKVLDYNLTPYKKDFVYNFSFIPWFYGNYTITACAMDYLGHINSTCNILETQIPTNITLNIVIANENITLKITNFNETINSSYNKTIPLIDNLTVEIIRNESIEAKLIFENVTYAKFNITLDYVDNNLSYQNLKKVVAVKTPVPRIPSKIIFNLSNLSSNGLVAYKCENWNLSQKSCNSSWIRYQNYSIVKDQLFVYTNSFSAYAIGYPVCGDGICDKSEDCSSCSQDCGVCKVTPTSSSGSSGSSFRTKEEKRQFLCDFYKDLAIEPDELNNDLNISVNLSYLKEIHVFLKNVSSRKVVHLLICINETLIMTNDLKQFYVKTYNFSNSDILVLYSPVLFLKADEKFFKLNSKNVSLNYDFLFPKDKRYNYLQYFFKRLLIIKCNESNSSQVLCNLTLEPCKFIVNFISLEYNLFNSDNEIENSTIKNNIVNQSSRKNVSSITTLNNISKNQNLEFLPINHKNSIIDMHSLRGYLKKGLLTIKYGVYYLSKKLSYKPVIILLTSSTLLLFVLLITLPKIIKKKLARKYLYISDQLSKFEHELKLYNYQPPQDLVIQIISLEDEINKYNFRDLNRRFDYLLSKIKSFGK